MDNNIPILDLHNIRHKDVFKIVDNFIGKHLITYTNEAHIITGHSKKMKEIVNEVLDDYELYSQESILNPGKLIINLTYFLANIIHNHLIPH